MADRYWNPAGASNVNVTSAWSDVDGGGTGFSVPVGTDNAYFTSTNNNNCVINATFSPKSLSFTGGTGYTGTVSGSQGITCSENLTLNTGMGWTHTGQITWGAGSTSGSFTCNTAGKTLGSFFIGHTSASTATFTLANDVTSNGTFKMYFGNLDTAGYNINCSEIDSSMSGTRSITLGDTIITTTKFNFATTTGLTLNADTSSFVVTLPASGNHAFSSTVGSSLTFYDFSITLSTGITSQTFPETLAFHNLTVTGSTSKLCQMSVSKNMTISNALTVNGNSSANRILIFSATLNSPITLTSASNTFSNVDFRDITGAGAGSWDLSAITGGSGNAGGNSGITFTTADDWYWHEGTGSYSTATKWYTETNGGGTQSTYPPLLQDTAHFDQNSFDSTGRTITQDMPRIGSITFLGATNTPTFTTSTSSDFYGDITLISGMTLTGSVNTYQCYAPSSAGTSVLTSTGKTWARTFSAIRGILQLGDSFNTDSTHGLNIQSGTIDTNDQSVTMGTMAGSSGSLIMDNSTITITGTDGTVWDIGSTGTITSSTNSLIKFTGTITSALIILLRGKTYNNIWINTTGSFEHRFNTTGGTMNEFRIDAGRAVRLQSGQTYTVSSLNWVGTSGNPITITASLAGSASTISDTTGTNNCDYLSLKDNTASGGATFNATNSSIVSNVTGWNVTGSFKPQINTLA